MLRTLSLLLPASLCFSLACGGDDDVSPDTSTLDAGRDTAEPVDAGTDTPASVCPSHIQVTNIDNGSHSDLGWTGFGHNLRVNDGAVTTLALDCDDSCRRCRLFGPVRNQGVSAERGVATDTGIDNQRCLNDTRVACRSDVDCEGQGLDDPFNPPRCRFIQGPPLALDTGARPACTLVHFVPPDDPARHSVEGSIDLETGAMNFTTFHLRSTSNGIPARDASGNPTLAPGGVCAQCVGDPTPNDGEQGGRCQLSGEGVPSLGEPSPGIGDSCDAHGFGSILGGTYSFDCPTVRSSDSIDFDLTNFGSTGMLWTLDDRRPECTNPALPEGTLCWCGVCSNDVGRPCQADSECGGGTCGFWDGTPPSEGGQVPTAPNGCRTPCEWDPEEARGTCLSAQFPDFPFPVGCFQSEPGSTMIAPGSAEVRGDEYFITLGTLNCLGVSGSPTTNTIFGLPGPALYTQTYQVTTQFRDPE